MSQLNPKTVILKNVRGSYLNLFKAVQGTDENGQPSGDPKFSACWILDKKANAADIKALEAAVAYVTKEKWPAKVPNFRYKAIRDGSEKGETEGYSAANVFISARSKSKPYVLDRDPRVPVDPTDPRIFSGAYFNVEVQAYAYDAKMNKGVAWGLNKVQYLREGEPLGAKQIPAEEVFENLEESPV